MIRKGAYTLKMKQELKMGDIRAEQMMLPTLPHSIRQRNLGCRVYLCQVYGWRRGLKIMRELWYSTTTVFLTDIKEIKCLWCTVTPSLLLPSNEAQWENKIFLYHLQLQNEKVDQSASNVLETQSVPLYTSITNGRKQKDKKKALIFCYFFPIWLIQFSLRNVKKENSNSLYSIITFHYECLMNVNESILRHLSEGNYFHTWPAHT